MVMEDGGAPQGGRARKGIANYSDVSLVRFHCGIDVSQTIRDKRKRGNVEIEDDEVKFDERSLVSIVATY